MDAISGGLQAAWDAVTGFFADLFGGASTPGAAGPVSGAPSGPGTPAPSEPGQPEPGPSDPPSSDPPSNDPPSTPPGGNDSDNPDGPSGGTDGGTDHSSGHGAASGALPSLPTGRGNRFGSGVVDPVETALGRITVTFIGAVGGDPVAFFASDGGDGLGGGADGGSGSGGPGRGGPGGGGGGGGSQPGMGTSVRTIGGPRVVGAGLQQFVPHFDRDPSPSVVQIARQVGAAGG